MNNNEKRKNPRIDSHNLISYTRLDENGNPVGQGMGRTLNISEGGILLETHLPIDPQYILSFTISLEDEIMDIKGRVAFNKKRDDEKYETGIQFIETDESRIQILKQFTVMFKDEVDQ
jgi:hypothetical protein